MTERDGPADLLARGLAAIDAVNADDPVTVVVDGKDVPREVARSRRVTHWLTVLHPDADAAQRLAARAHHLRRWALPRSDHPEGRAGYLQWRTAQKKRHAAEVEPLLRTVGFDEDTIGRVQSLVAKTGLGTDPAAQTHEDALCLAFLEQQYDALTDQLGEERMVAVLRRTARKMSPAGLAAVGDIDMTDRGRALLAEALRPTANAEERPGHRP